MIKRVDAIPGRHSVGAGTDKGRRSEAAHIAGIRISVRGRVFQIVGDIGTHIHGVENILGQRRLFNLGENVQRPDRPLALIAPPLMPSLSVALRHSRRQTFVRGVVIVERQRNLLDLVRTLRCAVPRRATIGSPGATARPRCR